MRTDARHNRQHLLAVAERVFLESGTGVRVEDIARNAYMAPTTVFRHFATKDALIGAVVDRRMARIAAVVRAAATDPCPRAAFDTTLRELLRCHIEERPFVGWILHEAETDAARLERYRREIHSPAAAVLRRAQRAGRVREDVTIEDVLSMCSALGCAYCPEIGRADLVQRLLDVFIDGLHPTPSPLAPAVVSDDERQAVFRHRVAAH